MNLHAVSAIMQNELGRTWRTLFQSLAAPVISTSLYFVVFGAAIGGNMREVDGITFAAFIVPGLILMSVMTESISNASFGIYLPRFTGTIYEVLSAPVSVAEILVGYVGAAVIKALILSAVIMVTARLFVDYQIQHPAIMLIYLVMICTTFALSGFIIGLWADGFEKLQIVPLLIVMPLAFLGGTFYSIRMLPDVWQTILLFNPVVYLINGFRWTFYGTSDISIWVSLGVTAAIMTFCIATIAWIFKTGYRLRS